MTYRQCAELLPGLAMHSTSGGGALQDGHHLCHEETGKALFGHGHGVFIQGDVVEIYLSALSKKIHISRMTFMDIIQGMPDLIVYNCHVEEKAFKERRRRELPTIFGSIIDGAAGVSKRPAAKKGAEQEAKQYASCACPRFQHVDVTRWQRCRRRCVLARSRAAEG